MSKNSKEGLSVAEIAGKKAGVPVVSGPEYKKEEGDNPDANSLKLNNPPGWGPYNKGFGPR